MAADWTVTEVAIPILPFDRFAAELAGKILAEAAQTGRRISCIDAQIAGHALAMDVPLITVRPRPIAVKGLRMVDWSSPRPSPARS